jgi:hypothetical protein
MPSIKCRGCGTNYKASGANSRCPVCERPHEEPAEAGGKSKGKKAAVAKGPVKCPVCGKALSAGVKFCAACGNSVGATDVGEAFAAGMQLEAKSERDINRARWQMFFWRFFRW